jgi:hypothetical protein
MFVVMACLAVPSLVWAEESSEQAKWRERVLLSAGQEVQGDYFAFGLHVEISGTVHGDVYAAGGEVLVDGIVGGDLIVAGGEVRVSGEVTQDVRYWSDGEPSIDEGATVLGTVTRRPISEVFKGEEAKRGLAGMKFIGGMVSFASTLLLGLLLLRIYSVFTPKVASMIQEKPWAVLCVGGVLLVGIPLLILLCMVSVLGIPIGLMLTAMYVVTLYMGRVFVVLWLGQRLMRLMSGSSSAAWGFVVGLVVYFVLSLVPVVGALLMLATIAAGLGAILMTKKELMVRLREEQVV